MKSIERDIADLLGSELFNPDWYVSSYRDVEGLSIGAAEHYLRFGALLGRAPGPLFDGQEYLNHNHDVQAAGVNPLLHYVRHGRQEGRAAPALRWSLGVSVESYLRQLAAAKLAGEPQRMFSTFDRGSETEFLQAVSTLAEAGPTPPTTRKISIVMPTYNRGSLIRRAIESVQAQTHQAWELLIVDDGSSDKTLQVVASFASDPRIKLFRQDHKGVSAARNTGLRNASGDWIFYLDSDNRWSPHFLRAMSTYLELGGQLCGYSGIAVENDQGEITGYRGEPFNWDSCIKGNYVDLNAFCHDRSLFEIHGGFDERLRRMVDWDLILRYTKRHGAAYAPFVGCYYLDSKTDAGRISVSQPIAYRSVVQTKNNLGTDDPKTISKNLKLRFAIKIPAPYDKRNEWGDFHYADSLKGALEALGHTVTIDFLNTWYDRPVNQDQVVIALRGLTAYEPRPGQINLLWNISHPDQVSYEEFEAYDMVYVASVSYTALLRTIVATPVKTLLQCSDSERFRFIDSAAGDESSLLFVGNSRNEYRKIVRWAVESGANLAVHGTRWEQFIDSDIIAGTNIDNTDLARHYAGARAVLNDHWDSMRDFGFVSNRVFDVLSCGGALISDKVPAIESLFGKVVTQISSRDELASALSTIGGGAGSAIDRKRLSDHIREHHSFAARARSICGDVLAHLGLPPNEDDGELRFDQGPARVKIGLLLQPGRRGPTSSGFIRLLAPLTTDAAHARGISVQVLDGVDDPRLDDCDGCIVQRVAVTSHRDAQCLVERLRRRGAALFVDNDDAFSLLTPGHAEKAAYEDKDSALRYLMHEADHVWFSTARLQAAYSVHAPRSSVAGNNLDPRLWRNYRQSRKPFPSGDRLRILYMGTATHDADFAVVVPALDRLNDAYPGQFEVVIVGAVRQPPARSWLSILPPPSNCGDYPRFVRWLMKQGPFDVGLAPLEDNDFNACKSDIKFIDYCALGLLPVLSDVPAYSGDAKLLGLALHARNTPEDWFATIEKVLLHRSEFVDTVRRGTEYVWQVRGAQGVLVEQVLSVVAERQAEKTPEGGVVAVEGSNATGTAGFTQWMTA
jgi:glycosyltransferase involved in cell wall biosynthesis